MVPRVFHADPVFSAHKFPAKKGINIAGIATLHALYMHITCSDCALVQWKCITCGGIDIACKITCSHSTGNH